LFYLKEGENMTTSPLALPTQELKENRPPAFCNGDEVSVSKNMTRRDVAAMAFRAVFSDKLGDPSYSNKIETI
jgi:hypothetical protein